MSGSFFYFAVGIGVYILLFFPVWIEGTVYYNVKYGKCAISLNLYKFLRLFGGYITLYSEGIAIHKSSKKALLIPYKGMKEEQKKFSFIKTFELVSARLSVDSGAEYIFVTEMFKRFYLIIKPTIKILKRTTFDSNLVEGDTFATTASLTVNFNLFILLTDVIEFLGRKIKHLWREKIKKSTI